MEHYKELYFYLINRITDAIEALEQQNHGQGTDILKNAQIQAEERYMHRTEGDGELDH